MRCSSVPFCDEAGTVKWFRSGGSVPEVHATMSAIDARTGNVALMRGVSPVAASMICGQKVPGHECGKCRHFNPDPSEDEFGRGVCTADSATVVYKNYLLACMKFRPKEPELACADCKHCAYVQGMPCCEHPKGYATLTVSPRCEGWESKKPERTCETCKGVDACWMSSRTCTCTPVNCPDWEPK